MSLQEAQSMDKGSPRRADPRTGSIQNTLDLPQDIEKRLKTVWEMSQKALIDLSKGRAPYVCQSQSLNLHISRHQRRMLVDVHAFLRVEARFEDGYLLPEDAAESECYSVYGGEYRGRESKYSVPKRDIPSTRNLNAITATR